MCFTGIVGNEQRIQFRISPDSKERFRKACEKVKLDDATVLRGLTEAFTDYVEENGRSPIFPITIGEPPRKDG